MGSSPPCNLRERGRHLLEGGRGRRDLPPKRSRRRPSSEASFESRPPRSLVRARRRPRLHQDLRPRSRRRLLRSCRRQDGLRRQEKECHRGASGGSAQTALAAASAGSAAAASPAKARGRRTAAAASSSLTGLAVGARTCFVPQDKALVLLKLPGGGIAAPGAGPSGGSGGSWKPDAPAYGACASRGTRFGR